jgi:hypothetical protein
MDGKVVDTRLLGGWRYVADDVRRHERGLRALPETCACGQGSAHLAGACPCCRARAHALEDGCTDCEAVLASLHEKVAALVDATLRPGQDSDGRLAMEVERSRVEKGETEIVRRRYDRGAWRYDLAVWPMELMAMSRFRRRLFDFVGGRRVLEVGVGTGKNLPLYRRLDPLAARAGPHINRRTVENIQAGLRIEREENLVSDIVKLIVARPLPS